MEIPLDSQAKQFSDVYKEELREIQERRRQAQQHTEADEELRDLTGLALSGGGIRSATFCLGLLEGLHDLGVLNIFDYLSTVSGGGFVGGWWSAWLSREGRESGELFPPPERIEPERSVRYQGDESRRVKLVESSISAGVDPIHHLRLFANYLTPRRGALSMDTWRAITFISRNLVLTWLVLLPILVATVLLGQLYFVVFSAGDFPHENMLTVQRTANDQETKKNLTDSFIHKPSDERELWVRTETLKKRAWLAVYPVAILGAVTVFFAFCWMIGIQSGPKLLRLTNGFMGLTLLVILIAVFLGSAWAVAVSLISLVGVVIIVCVVLHVPSTLFKPVRLVIRWLKMRGLNSIQLRDSLDRLRDLFGHLRARIGARLERAERSNGADMQWQKEVYLNAMTRWTARMLVILVVTAGVLAISGFGHEAVEYVCCYTAPGGTPLKAILHYVSKSLSITSVFGAIAGLIYTWGRAAPTGGGDKSENNKPAAASRLIFAITPPLVIVVLAVTIAWLAHALVWFIVANQPDSIEGLTMATRVGIGFAFFLVLLEIDLSEIRSRTAYSLLGTLIVANLVVVLWLFRKHEIEFTTLPIWSFGILFIVGVVVAIRFILRAIFRPRGMTDMHWLGYVVVGVLVYLSSFVVHELIPKSELGILRQRWFLTVMGVVISLALLKPLVTRMNRSSFFYDPETGYKVRFFVITALLLFLFLGSALAISALLNLMLGQTLDVPADREVFASSVRGIVRCGIVFLVLVFVQMTGDRSANRRSFWLVTSLLLVLTTLAMMTFIHEDWELNYTATPLRAVILLTTTALAWVLTLGWIVDPNSLSIHSFYKGRLVRAYLGASNIERTGKQKEVTESVKGDDVLLSDLQNCRQGAPYHLINTTLNLVGGRDLTTAQRSSAMFVLSKKYCGSLRTGYRETNEYMGGDFSLGTAVAVSGAAVSPNMGSLKTTASLAMLMTLLNVRLGYWAPTPSKSRWRSPQARLWPYYVLREFLSETTDLSSYCYLTDGGHFDNSGLYSLVERGCRYIVMVDASADPGPCFADLGNAARRCRIDFDAEVELDVTPLIKRNKDEKFGKQNYVVGTIRYSPTHFKQLGWETASDKDLEGVIVYIKPGLLDRDPELAVDARQYGIENPIFPQQTTADQWFDEAQFESYRALGYHAAQLLIGSLDVDHGEAYANALQKQQKGEQPLFPEEEIILQAHEAREKIKAKKILPSDVPGLFQLLHSLRPT
jgi:hypothetical protein